MANILIIDDDPNIVESYKMELELSGHQVTPAYDGESGLKLSKEDNFELILLDLSLPKMHGLSVLEELKKDEKTKGLPVIVLSNFATDEHIQKALQLGAYDFIPKYSFTPQETANKIKSIFSQPQVLESKEESP